MHTIEGRADLVKDPDTGAIINIDDAAHRSAVAGHKARQRAKEEIKNVKISVPKPNSNAASPDLFLKNLMKEKKIDFTVIREKMVKEDVKGASEWESVKDIPRLKMFEIIERMQKKR